MSTVLKYNDYLIAKLPDEYPIPSIPLSFQMTLAHRKELIFNQNIFLEAASAQLINLPWISFMAAKKHLKILEIYDTNTSTFADFDEKEYFNNVQKNCLNIINESSLLLDTITKVNCDRIVSFQMEYYNIVKTIDILEKAINIGIKSFKLHPIPPQKTNWFSGCLIVIVLTVLLMAVSGSGAGFVGFISFFGGWFILSLIYKPKIDKEKIEFDIYETYKELRESYYSHTKNFNKSLSLDPNIMASDLINGCETFKSLIHESNTLVDVYLKEYIY
jgi:hypothetical protein